MPEQLWDELVAGGGIDAAERRRVREQRLVPNPAQPEQRLWMLQAAQQLQQDVQQARELLNDPDVLLREAQVAVNWLQRQGAAQQPQEPAAPVQLVPLLMALHEILREQALGPGQQQQQAQHLAAQLEELLGLRDPGQEQGQRSWVQALARLLHGLRTGGSWAAYALKYAGFIGQGLSTFFASSGLPAAEQQRRPPSIRSLLPDIAVTAGVLGLLALSERQQLGSWRAVWQRGYSAWHARLVAKSCVPLAASMAVQRWVAAARSTPGASSHQSLLADAAYVVQTASLLRACMVAAAWPSLLHLVCWAPLAAAHVAGSLLARLVFGLRAPWLLPSMPALTGLRSAVSFWAQQLGLSG